VYEFLRVITNSSKIPSYGYFIYFAKFTLDLLLPGCIFSIVTTCLTSMTFYKHPYIFMTTRTIHGEPLYVWYTLWIHRWYTRDGYTIYIVLNGNSASTSWWIRIYTREWERGIKISTFKCDVDKVLVSRQFKTYTLEMDSLQSNGDCRQISTIHFIYVFYLFDELWIWTIKVVWLHECREFGSQYPTLFQVPIAISTIYNELYKK
jgi:hypothetical protein